MYAAYTAPIHVRVVPTHPCETQKAITSSGFFGTKLTEFPAPITNRKVLRPIGSSDRDDDHRIRILDVTVNVKAYVLLRLGGD